VLGNSLCTLLSRDELVAAVKQVRSKLRAGGIIIAGVRDYAATINRRPLWVDGPMLCFDGGNYRIVHQVWVWIDELRYDALVYIDRPSEYHRAAVRCRAVLPDELSGVLREAGFTEIEWLPGNTKSYGGSVYHTGFDQLIVVARAGSLA
jgi:hypothetical protein